MSKKIWEYSKKLPYFSLKKYILNYLNISENNIISVEASKVIQ